ncbi:universal stress protein [Roseospira visakhapatnamensis]|uniref:Nucleotide-binding universal stress UspA family protein n=1 Tax=Roseospira visakhapatnamensis TaxID=390880 RepID=A0A7W6W8U4_9PROT|nr:universal stress protein [Roseospira visakhapatnamensis]MBB4264771.1 nucleotide-binding universal stress UspA family protein [Roseospira visakhapatnamensis]
MHDPVTPVSRTDPGASLGPEDRTFLVVVDGSVEQRAALRFACRRAGNTGGHVALLYVTEPAEFAHWGFVGKRMRDEAREDAESLLQRQASLVGRMTGRMPALFVREGTPTEELLALLDEEPEISVVVLASGSGKDGPGPLITALTGKQAHRLRVPMTIVPGDLSDAAIDGLA